MVSVLARNDIRPQLSTEPIDVSLSSTAVIQDMIGMDFSNIPSLDVSHNDLGTCDGKVEVQILQEQWKIINATSAIKKGKIIHDKSSKEKDFAVAASKRRDGKKLQEDGTAELEGANEALESLSAILNETLWSKLLKSGIPPHFTAKNCGLLAGNLQRLLEDDVSVRIQYLALDGNYFGDLGAQEISKLMQKSITLEELSLRNCGLSDEGVSIVVAALVSNKTLKKVDLRNNSLASATSEAAIKGMKIFNRTCEVIF